MLALIADLRTSEKVARDTRPFIKTYKATYNQHISGFYIHFAKIILDFHFHNDLRVS